MSSINPYKAPAAKPKYQTTLERSLEEQKKAAKAAAKKKSEEKTTTKDK